MPIFDETHEHAPAPHVPEGVWANGVGGFSPGSRHTSVFRPDISDLVQHIVDRDDWQSGSAIGFLGQLRRQHARGRRRAQGDLPGAVNL